MRKAELIVEISKKTGIEKAKVEAIIETFMSSVQEHVIKKETVSFRGFGNFVVRKREAKIGRNITKNTAVTVPAHYIPFFRAAKVFNVKVKKTVK